MDVDKMNAAQRRAVANAAAKRRAQLASDAKAGKLLPKSTPTPAKKSLSERFDNITRGPNAPAKKPKPSGPGLVERVQDKLDGVARGKNAPPKNKDAVAAAANRRTGSAEQTRNSRMYSKINNRTYKGKYYGPDEFKGNLTKIKAWRAAGRPRNADGSPKV